MKKALIVFALLLSAAARSFAAEGKVILMYELKSAQKSSTLKILSDGTVYVGERDGKRNEQSRLSLTDDEVRQLELAIDAVASPAAKIDEAPGTEGTLSGQLVVYPENKPYGTSVLVKSINPEADGSSTVATNSSVSASQLVKRINTFVKNKMP